MNKSNKLALKILTEDEKAALMLSINYNKSTWQAGEIMGKAHYKYLEIQARANKFFKMFSEYFEATGDLRIPSTCNLNPFFRDFIVSTVFERKSPKEAIAEQIMSPLTVTSAKERIFDEQFKLLYNSEDPINQLFYDLIKEFDRWNNFRVLSISFQEPSAFKRRNKTRLIKHLNNLSNLDEFHIERFIKRFKWKPGRELLYVAVLRKESEGGYDIIPINGTKDVVEWVSKHLRLYIFKDEVDADTFGFLVNKYLSNPNKDCKVGQKFWPVYRKTIELAYNYLDVNNIIPRRKHLEKAFRDMDDINIKKKSKKDKLIGDPQARGKEEQFWSSI